MSRPSWARGLKYDCRIVEFGFHQVAPLMGAWIEMII